MLKIVSNLIRQADLWNKKNKERINVNRHKKQEYFVNAIDVAQNIVAPASGIQDT